MNILVTGCAGFIGFHLCQELLKKKNNKIIGVDNLNNYYDPSLKKARINELINLGKSNFVFLKGYAKMDVIYNVGDAINKIGFGLVVYNLAVQSK